MASLSSTPSTTADTAAQEHTATQVPPAGWAWFLYQYEVAAVSTAVGVRPGKGTSLLNDRVEGSTAQLRCIYINAHRMGNKREKLAVIAQQENYDIVAITET